jgi:hypothetical protein
MSQGFPVTVAELLSCSAPPLPHEAVAIAIELCNLVVARQAADAVPSAISPSTVRIDPSGAVAVAGGVPGEDEQTVSLIGHLLVEMLRHPGSEPDADASPRLVATAARAAIRGRGAFASVAHLAAALRRHAPDQRHSAIRALYDRSQTALGRAGALRMPDPRAAVRFLREVDEDSSQARLAAAGASDPAQHDRSDGDRAPGARLWFTTALVVGVTLLLLAGTGALFLFTADDDPAPMIAPRTKPTPVSPPREPGWELLGKPERAMAVPAPGAHAPTRSVARAKPRLIATPPDPTDPSHAAAVQRQQDR